MNLPTYFTTQEVVEILRSLNADPKQVALSLGQKGDDLVVKARNGRAEADALETRVRALRSEASEAEAASKQAKRIAKKLSKPETVSAEP